MSDGKFVDSITSVLSTLIKAAALYDSMKGDTDLPQAFHAVGDALGPVQQTLEGIKAHSKRVPLAWNKEGAVRSMEECSEKAKLLERILDHTAPRLQTSRRTRYHTALMEQGRRVAVEVLMMKIMNEICFLAKEPDGVIEAATELHVEALRNAMDRLSTAERSMPDNQVYGSATQINIALGPGTRQINTVFEGSFQINSFIDNGRIDAVRTNDLLALTPRASGGSGQPRVRMG